MSHDTQVKLKVPSAVLVLSSRLLRGLDTETRPNSKFPTIGGIERTSSVE